MTMWAESTGHTWSGHASWWFCSQGVGSLWMQHGRDDDREEGHLPCCHCQGEIGASKKKCQSARKSVPQKTTANRWATRGCPKIAPICFWLAMCLSLNELLPPQNSLKKFSTSVISSGNPLIYRGEIIQSENRTHIRWLSCLITQTSIKYSKEYLLWAVFKNPYAQAHS